jgi:hypothetical protein
LQLTGPDAAVDDAPQAGMVVAAVKPKAKKKSVAAQDEVDSEQEEPLVAGHIDGFDDDDEGDNSGSESVEHCSGVYGDGPSELAPTFKASKEHAMTTLIVKLGGTTRKRDVDLRQVEDLAGLQQMVAKICRGVGADLQGGLRMLYTDANGEQATVSKSTNIRSIRHAKTLTLVPKHGSLAQRSGDESRRGDGRRPPANIGAME